MNIDKKNGRPESFNAEYFSHSVHESDVLKVMYRKFKYEGYTADFRLKEQVAKAEYHRIELKNDTQWHIFLMNMDVSREVIDFLINVLLQTGEMNSEQWEKNQTIYLDKFVKQFKKLWYDRWKSIPDADGNYIDRSQNKETNIVSSKRNGDSIVKYNIIKESRKNSSKELSLSDFKKEYPQLKDVTKSLDKYKSFTKKPTKEGARNWLNREKNIKPPEFKKSNNGSYVAWCSKCFSKQFPNDYQIKQGSECCRVEYLNEKPTKNQTSSNLTKKKGVA